jgi:Phage integrase family
VGEPPHELRHTAASLAIASGANVKDVQRMLGHAQASMTLDVYAGLFEDGLDDVADRMDGLARAAADSLRTGGQIVSLPDRGNGADRALTSGNTKWGSRGLNPGPTDYECDRNPHGTPTIRRFGAWLLDAG